MRTIYSDVCPLGAKWSGKHSAADELQSPEGGSLSAREPMGSEDLPVADLKECGGGGTPAMNVLRRIAGLIVGYDKIFRTRNANRSIESSAAGRLGDYF